ncbi:MAG: ankyrin repeat domain-containing protein [Urechidicola sp.]|nr:ankyrin repeat domain-containing protein [Urechidicola sp.]
MKNLLLTSLLVVAVVFNSFATNNKTNPTNETSTTVETVSSDNTSTEALTLTTESLNYYNVIRHLKTDSFVKLIQLNDYNAVRNLILAGAEINKKSIGMTPLMYAARQNKVAIVKLLLEEGAKVDSQSQYGLTALDYAQRSHATESYYLIKNAMEI